MQNTATVHPDGTGVVTIDGQEPTRITGHSVDETRRALLGHVIEHARRTGQHVDVLARDPEAEHRLRVHPDGRVQPLPAQVPPAPGTPLPGPTPTSHPPAQIQPAPQHPTNGIAPMTTPAPRKEAPTMTQTEHPVQTRREARERSFLADARMSAPPPTGWQAFLARLGIKSGPTPEEISKWEDERAISQHWPGPRTIAVLNGKGGAGKTPATALLSAMFARAGGSGVLAWDNNVTRGTLGWRTESGPHEATVLDLIPRTDELLTPGARAADLAAVVHHQTIDKYDVLRSNPLLLSTEQKLTPDQLDAVHAVAAKYYRLIFMDSGNDEGDALWLRRIVGIVTPAPTPTTTMTSDSATPTASPATGTIETMPSKPTRRPGIPGTGKASSSIHENRRTQSGSGREFGTSLPRLRRTSRQAARGEREAVGRTGTAGGPATGASVGAA